MDRHVLDHPGLVGVREPGYLLLRVGSPVKQVQLGVGPGDEVLETVGDPRGRILRRHSNVCGVNDEVGSSHGTADSLD